MEKEKNIPELSFEARACVMMIEEAKTVAEIIQILNEYKKRLPLDQWIHMSHFQFR